MTDTHCHLDDARFDGEREEIIASFEEDGLEFVVNNSSSPETTESTFLLAERYPRIFGALGCHPQEAERYSSEYERRLIGLADNPKIVAIGEIGLDYHYEGFDKELQRRVFERQLAIADELKLPVVLHVRDATGDAYEILKANSGKLRYGGEMHCYGGSAEMVGRFSEFDLYFAFGGSITYKNAKKEGIIRAVPKNRLLSETDCPYLAPVPVRGQTNYPKYVRFALEKMADILGTSFSEVEKLTTENAKRLFGIR